MQSQPDTGSSCTAGLFVIVTGYLVSEVTRETGRNPGRVKSGCSGVLGVKVVYESRWGLR